MNDFIEKYCGTFFQNKTSLISVFNGDTWNYLMQTFDYTRSYEDGLVFLTKLLGEIEKEKDSLSKEHYEKCIELTYYKLLDYLDKLDRWEEYLEAWERIFQNVKIGLTYSNTVLSRSGISPFILKVDKSYVHIHFLWMGHSRKERIERKLEKKRAGRYPGKLHEQQSELTPKEIKERFDWMVKFRTAGIYDLDPSASRQRKKRLEDKKRTIDMEPIVQQKKELD